MQLALPTRQTQSGRAERNKKLTATLKSSRAVPHPSTNQALCRLTSEVRDPVYSTRYGRQRHDVCEQHHGITRLAASRGLHARALEQPGVAQLVLLPTSIASGGRKSECGLRDSFEQVIYQQIVYTSRFVRASFARGQCLSFNNSDVVRCGRYRNIQTCFDSLRI